MFKVMLKPNIVPRCLFLDYHPRARAKEKVSSTESLSYVRTDYLDEMKALERASRDRDILLILHARWAAILVKIGISITAYLLPY